MTLFPISFYVNEPYGAKSFQNFKDKTFVFLVTSKKIHLKLLVYFEQRESKKKKMRKKNFHWRRFNSDYENSPIVELKKPQVIRNYDRH